MPHFNLLEAQDEFHRRFQWLRARVGGTITNCTRSTETNLRVGGNPRSQHLYGLACDLVWFGNPRTWPVERVRRLGATRGLVVIDERNRRGYRPHVHVQRYVAGYLERAMTT